MLLFLLPNDDDNDDDDATAAADADTFWSSISTEGNASCCTAVGGHRRSSFFFFFVVVGGGSRPHHCQIFLQIPTFVLKYEEMQVRIIALLCVEIQSIRSSMHSITRRFRAINAVRFQFLNRCPGNVEFVLAKCVCRRPANHCRRVE